MSFKEYQPNQQFIFPPSLSDFLPEDHLALVIHEVVNSLNLSQLYARYSDLGCSAYHPLMLLKILFYGYSTGERSSRKLAYRIKSDVAYMFLSALQQPDFRTINRFRKDHLPVLKELFNQLVRLCIEMGMVNLGSIALDGTKLKANASDRKTLRARDLDKELKRLDKEIEEILRESEEIDTEEDRLLGEDQGLYEIPPELRDKKVLKEKLQRAKEKLQEQQLKQINLTDNDCTTMLHGPQGFKPSYNGQVAVEAGRGIILAANLSTNPADNLALKELIEQVEANSGEKPKIVLADSGFSSYANLQYLEDKEITGYIPDQGSESLRKGNCKNPAYHKSRFIYNADSDTYTCPEGKVLKYYKTSKRPNPRPPLRIYRAKACTLCPVKLNCTRSKYRYLRRDPREPLMLKMRALLNTPEGRVKYNQRKQIVEPVFGDLKHNQNLGQLLLRGKLKATGEFLLMCMAHNLRKISKYLRESRENTNYQPQYA